MDIIAVAYGGEHRVDSRKLSDCLDNRHKNVLALIDKHITQFRSLGALAFETRALDAGGLPQRWAMLNEGQCYYLLTLARNNEAVVALKLALVQTFQRTREQLGRPPISAVPVSPLALSRAILEALEQQEGRVAAIEARLDLAPIMGAQIGTIYRLGQQLGQLMDSYPQAWQLFKSRFQLASYRDLPSCQYQEAVQFLESQLALGTQARQSAQQSLELFDPVYLSSKCRD